jgi:hypothetical protein
MKDLTHNGRVSGRNLNSGPPEYEGVKALGRNVLFYPRGKNPWYHGHEAEWQKRRSACMPLPGIESQFPDEPVRSLVTILTELRSLYRNHIRLYRAVRRYFVVMSRINCVRLRIHSSSELHNTVLSDIIIKQANMSNLLLTHGPRLYLRTQESVLFPA